MTHIDMAGSTTYVDPDFDLKRCRGVSLRSARKACDMRLSADQGDPGFRPNTQNVKVFFNGVERTHVITADEERRTVVVCALDERGHVQIDWWSGEIRRETLYGDVRIEISEEGDRS